ncbi:MAG: hypothetical protein FWD46_01200 [Cystobacterineae bacterium]|nr:hypothetical protein [Cystobacterineae bacterium]
MLKSSAWSSWETKARHGVMACGLGVVSTAIGSWASTWIVKWAWRSHGPFIENVFAGWLWNAGLWLVFAPIALLAARVLPTRAALFVGLGGISGFFFRLFLDTALFGFERFSDFPLYGLSCLFWFITGLVWAWFFARWGEHFFRKAQENARALSKSNERYYAQQLASSMEASAGDTNACADPVSSSETEAEKVSGETGATEAKRNSTL